MEFYLEGLDLWEALKEDCIVHPLSENPTQGYQIREFTKTRKSFIDSTRKLNS